MNPLWTKAPRVLLQLPALFGAITAATALLTFAAAAYPLFISVTEDRLLRSGVATGTVTRYGAGIHYEASNIALGEPPERSPGEPRIGTPEQIERAFTRRTASISG